MTMLRIHDDDTGKNIDVYADVFTTCKSLYDNIEQHFPAFKRMTQIFVILNHTTILPKSGNYLHTYYNAASDDVLSIRHAMIPLRVRCITDSGTVAMELQVRVFYKWITGTELWRHIAPDFPDNLILKGMAWRNLNEDFSMPVLKTDSVFYDCYSDGVVLDYIIVGDESDIGGTGGRRGDKHKSRDMKRRV